MATIDVKNLEGQTVKQLELSDAVFGAEPNQGLLWDVVKAYLASQRRGTHKTKSRGEVRGGGKKPWRQKGTGRARAGSNRSSLWRHGSIAHGPVPRDYAVRPPAKMVCGALRSAMAAKLQENKLTVVEGYSSLPELKTKTFASALKKLGVVKTVLLVHDEADRKLDLSSRNIAGCDLLRHHEVHAYDVLSHEALLISESALVRMQKALQ